MKKSIFKYKTNIIIIALLLVLLVGGTYAWLTFTVTSDKNNVIKSGVLSLKLDESLTNGISMPNAYPMTDAEGLATTAYTFKLQNDGTVDSNYEVYIDDLDIDSTKVRMPDNIVKYSLIKNDEAPVTALLSTLGGDPNRIIDSGLLKPDEEVSYTLRVWMDYDAGNEQQGKVFAANIRAEGNQVIK